MASRARDSSICGVPCGGRALSAVRTDPTSTPHTKYERTDDAFTVVFGEIFNFAAYAFAPAILVTPLGALSVLIGAVLGSYILKEELGTLGKLGSAICLIGAVIIVLHAPPDEDIETIDKILEYAIQPGMSWPISPFWPVVRLR
jgi:hypothetical protein